MKKLKYNVILLLITTLIILFFVLKDDFDGIVDVLLNSNIWYMLLVLLLIGLGDLFKSMSIYSIINGSNKEIKIVDAFLLTLKTDFFNNITPFSLGGQPYQLYTLKKERNIDYATGTNIIFRDFYSYQLAFVTLGVLFISLNLIFKFIIITNIIRKFILVGFLINILLEAFLLYITYKKNSNYKITNKIITFLSKIKIIKEKDNTINRVNSLLSRFKNQVNEIKTNPKLIIKSYLFNMLKLLTLGLAAFASFRAIGVTSVNVYVSISAVILTMLMASYVPIPGGSGGMELGFFSLFSTYVIGSKLSAALILWRVTGYYLLSICGGLAFALGNRK